MALIQCPECRQKVSDRAEICHHCGYQIKNNVVNKYDENLLDEKNMKSLLEEQKKCDTKLRKIIDNTDEELPQNFDEEVAYYGIKIPEKIPEPTALRSRLH